MVAAAARHQPVRMCASCREHRSKADLKRYTIRKGQLLPDLDGKSMSRGLYFCNDACHEQFTHRKTKNSQLNQSEPKGVRK